LLKDRKWAVAPRNAALVRRLAQEAGISKITAQVLLQRGLDSALRIKRFLFPDLEQLHDPFRFEQMRPAVERVQRAIRSGEKIGIYGDYDVDGIAGSAILTLYLRLHGAGAESYIPHRAREGYGLNIAAIDELAARGVRVLITVDCGTTAPAEVERAVSHGIDVIVLDHHEPGGPVPPALAIINPKARPTGYPFEGICSGGLAFKFAWALSESMPVSWKQSPRYRDFLLTAFSLATLATVADVSPLTDENRVLVRFGLEAMRAVPNLGLRLLFEKARVDSKGVTEFDIGFRLAPRLNAIGRMGHARDAVELLTSEDEASVRRIIDVSEKANRERQKTEAAILDEALYQMERGFDPARDPVVVVAGRGWHSGVVGVIAARLVDRTDRPAIVLSIEGERARGSARSVEGFNVAEALAGCREKIPGMRSGGHAMAAGLELPAAALDRLRELLAEAAARLLAGDPRAPLAIDDEVSLAHVTTGVCRELDRLSPHGYGNPEPLLAVRSVKVSGEPRLMKEKHVAFMVGDGERAMRVVAFGMGHLANDLARHTVYDLAFTPQINSYAGEEVELILKDIRYVR
jgi:single-stranded-DNA-specific exonuclease